MMSRKAIDVWVGMFVLASLAALFFLALKVASSSNTFTNGAGYHVQARVENIGGLKTRAPVRSAGAVVGRVDSIQVDHGSFEAVVTPSLASHVAFPKATSAKV